MKFVGMVLLFVCLTGSAMACAAVPEVSPATGVAALALVSGALLVIRGRRRH